MDGGRPQESSDAVWQKLRQTVKGIDKASVRVGVLGANALQVHAGGSYTNVQIAVTHEFGAPAAGIPERSFIRSTFVTRRDELVKLQAAACRGILAGKYSIEHALGLIGAWAAGAVREQITKYGPFLFAPLAARTIAAKGKSGPLVDSGQLVGSITFVVLTA